MKKPISILSALCLMLALALSPHNVPKPEKEITGIVIQPVNATRPIHHIEHEQVPLVLLSLPIVMICPVLLCLFLHIARHSECIKRGHKYRKQYPRGMLG